MWAAILAFLMWLYDAFFKSASKAVSYVAAGGKEALSVAGDWYSDLTTGEKAAVLTTGSFLLAPDASASVVGAVGDAMGDATSSVFSATMDTAGSVISTILNNKYFWMAAIGLGIWWLVGDDDE